MEQKDQNECFCTKNTFSFSKILFAEDMVPEEIILNEVWEEATQFLLPWESVYSIHSLIRQFTGLSIFVHEKSRLGGFKMEERSRISSSDVYGYSVFIHYGIINYNIFSLQPIIYYAIIIYSNGYSQS